MAYPEIKMSSWCILLFCILTTKAQIESANIFLCLDTCIGNAKR